MDRRKFVSTAAAASGILFLKPKTVFGYEANSAVRIALLGCGSRGTSVAESFLNNTSARVVAVADLFADKLGPAKTRIDQVGAGKGYPTIDSKMMFHGYKAFEEVAASPGRGCHTNFDHSIFPCGASRCGGSRRQACVL